MSKLISDREIGEGAEMGWKLHPELDRILERLKSAEDALNKSEERLEILRRYHFTDGTVSREDVTYALAARDSFEHFEKVRGDSEATS